MGTPHPMEPGVREGQGRGRRHRNPTPTPSREGAPPCGTPKDPQAKMPSLTAPNPPTLFTPNPLFAITDNNNNNVSTNEALTPCQAPG